MMEARIPPHSLQAEQAVLGGVMIEPSAVHRVADMLAPEDFYRADHALIWRAVRSLGDRGKPVDPLTVADALGKELEDAGGRGYIGQMSIDTSSAANIRHYAGIVKDRAMRRDMIREAVKIAEAGYNEDGKADKLLADAQGRLLQIGADTGTGPRMVREHLAEWLELIDQRSNSPTGITGLATGYRDFDKRTTGLHPGNFVVVAGRPGMGKTSFGGGIAANVARAGKTALVFSMEMSGPELAERTMAAETQVGLHAMRSAQLDPEHWNQLSKATKQIGGWPLVIDDTPALKIAQIRARARRVKHKHGLSLVIVDYLSLAQGDGDGRVNQVSDVSRGLKALAKELQVPVIALSQLNREVEKRPNRRPIISDLRETGQVEQDADLIVFLYRDKVYNPESVDQNLAEINIAKHRNGSTGFFPMVFLEQIASYVDADPGAKLTSHESNVTSLPKRGGGFGDL